MCICASRLLHLQGDAAKIGFMVMAILSQVLEQMQPTDFQSYAQFKASCNSCISSIGHVVGRLAAVPPCLACKLDNNTKLVHAHMARVRGCLRRVLEPEERFYSATEHAGPCCPRQCDAMIAPVDLRTLLLHQLPNKGALEYTQFYTQRQPCFH